MTQEQFRDLLRRYRQGLCTSAEKKFIDDWFAAISPERKPFSEVGDLDLVKERSWSRVDQHLRHVEKRARPLVRWSLAGMAATLLVLLGTGWYLNTKETAEPVITRALRETHSDHQSISNEGSDVKELVLPDESRIQLLPGSSIRFLRTFVSKKREVFLDGEAFFQVTPDKVRPFLVYTQEITTEVLGTSFLIKAYKHQEEVVVTVKTGKVSVYTNIARDPGQTKPHQEVILSSNQQVIYNASEQLTLKTLVSEPQVILPEPTLKDSYTNAPVIQILTNLEENYGIDIRYDAAVLSNCTLTSDMSDEGFYEQIKIICNALGAQYKVVETAIVIEATGCNTR